MIKVVFHCHSFAVNVPTLTNISFAMFRVFGVMCRMPSLQSFLQYQSFEPKPSAAQTNSNLILKYASCAFNTYIQLIWLQTLQWSHKHTVCILCFFQSFFFFSSVCLFYFPCSPPFSLRNWCAFSFSLNARGIEFKWESAHNATILLHWSQYKNCIEYEFA